MLVDYSVNYRFVDENSRLIFDRLWENFKLKIKNRKYDVHQDYAYKYVYPG